MNKCTDCGAELGEGHKFCGSCGTAAPQPMTKCINDHAVAPTAKFCGECGENLGDAHADYDAGMSALADMLKASTGIGEDFEIKADDKVEDGELAELMSGSKPEGKDGELVDAGLFLKAIHADNQLTIAGIRQLGAEVRTARRDYAVMAKACHALMGRVKGLEGTIATKGNERNARKSAVSIHDKVPAGERVASGDEDNSPAGGFLMTKCLEMKSAGALSTPDVQEMERLQNQTLAAGGKGSLKEIATLNPHLASRVASQFKAQSQQVGH